MLIDAGRDSWPYMRIMRLEIFYGMDLDIGNDILDEKEDE